jgi:tetratricopeptide (TPR) repeat protein
MEAKMKKVLFLIVLFFLLIVSSAWGQNMENAGSDYTMALQKKGQERVRAFEEYVKRYPDPKANVFTKYAFYWLALEHYNQKNYAEAIVSGEKAIAVGIPEKRNEAQTFLILASSYGVKGSPRYNQAQATKYAEKAISFSRENGFEDLVKQGQAMKNEISGATAAPKGPQTPVDKINALYGARNYEGAISLYNSFGEGDKKNQTILEIYADSLFQANRLDQALEKFNEAFDKQKKAMSAERIAEIYAKKAKKDKKFLDNAASAYIEAGLFHKKEGSSSRSDGDFQLAKFQIGEKYNFNERAKKYSSAQKNVKPKVDNTKEIKKLEKEYAQLERKLNAQYQDIAMPDYEQARLDKITVQIEKLKGGVTADSGDSKLDQEGEALMKEKEKIDSEYSALLEKSKKKVGIS